jgi:magnesium-transporting ATPase (P-type)
MWNLTGLYNLTVAEVFEALESSRLGLTASEAEARLKKYGYNELKFRRVGTLIRFLRQFHNSLIYVLLLAALVTGFLGHWIDTAVIIGVVIANTVIGFIQEGKAESSIEALENMMTPHP